MMVFEFGSEAWQGTGNSNTARSGAVSSEHYVALRWVVEAETVTVVVSGRGIIDRAFIEEYLLAMTAMGAKGYRKLFDLTHAAFEIQRDDVSAVAQALMQFGADGRAGPVAIVVGMSPLALDMAVLLKQNIEPSRPFRVFRGLSEARQWLRLTPVR
jgi:hypothetical protein